MQIVMHIIYADNFFGLGGAGPCGEAPVAEPLKRVQRERRQ